MKWDSDLRQYPHSPALVRRESARNPVRVARIAPTAARPLRATQRPQNRKPLPPDTPEASTEDANEPDTFPRSVVEELRRENARYRTRAGQADDIAQRLHLELVRATGRLADPTDLAFDEGHLEDVDILDAAIDQLLSRKPHLASRRPQGDIGQGATGSADSVDLASILRARAG